MIPKVIHYCWFGRGKMPPLAEKCIESWKKLLPEYEIRRWDETTFDLNLNSYVKEAYEKKKFAFVTDFVRLWALEKDGGVYMDTDVEVLKPLDRFLMHPAFSGFESDTEIPTGIMASEPHGLWVRQMLSYYEGRHFVLADGTLDMTTNVKVITDLMRDEGFRFDNTLQNYKNIVVMYPKDYFCPKSHKTGLISITANTHTIHHFNGSWQGPYERLAKFVRISICKVLGRSGERWIKRIRKVKRFLHVR